MRFTTTIKHTLGQKKVGYIGALDPFAWGLMPICVGRACRFADYLLALAKVYVALVYFGQQTDTWDATGQAVVHSNHRPSAEAVEAGVANLIGAIEHPVPPSSAKKRGGRPLYEAFHAGQPLEGITSVVTVYDARVLWCDDSRRVEKALIFFKVSKGTYIRGLVHLLGQRLGSPCTVAELGRLSVGSVNLTNAVGVNQISTASVVPPDVALSFLPAVSLDGLQYAEVKRTGRATLTDIYSGHLVRVYHGQEFVGVGGLDRGSLVMKSWW